MSKKKLGFGLMRLPLTDPNDDGSIDMPQMKQMVDSFLEQGFTYFDTAWMYNGFASESVARQALVEHLAEHVQVYCGVRCTGITEEGILAADSYGNQALLEADTVVLAAGMRARHDLAEQFRGLSLFFEPIGDCVVAKNVRGATRSAYGAASRI